MLNRSHREEIRERTGNLLKIVQRQRFHKASLGRIWFYVHLRRHLIVFRFHGLAWFCFLQLLLLPIWLRGCFVLLLCHVLTAICVVRHNALLELVHNHCLNELLKPRLVLSLTEALLFLF